MDHCLGAALDYSWSLDSPKENGEFYYLFVTEKDFYISSFRNFAQYLTSLELMSLNYQKCNFFF